MVTPATDSSATPELEPELVVGTVLWFDGRFGWARPDRGGPDVYLDTPELARAGIERLAAGARLVFEVRQATHKRKPWAARIRLAEPTA
jgi:cold shock CspA family protein